MLKTVLSQQALHSWHLFPCFELGQLNPTSETPLVTRLYFFAKDIGAGLSIIKADNLTVKLIGNLLLAFSHSLTIEYSLVGSQKVI